VKVPAVGVQVATLCAAGAYRAPFGPCLPCPAGTYKPAAGEEACTACPLGTLDATVLQVTLVQSATSVRVNSSAAGALTCGCLDASQVYSLDARACVCAPGFVPSPHQAATLAAWRLDGAAGPPMCDQLAGVLYKAAAGDSLSLVDACPVGTQPTADYSSCVCPHSDLAFEPLSGNCTCAAGLFAIPSAPNGTNATSGSGAANCTVCPDGTYKAGTGNAASLCLPCPFGATHNLSRTGCAVNASVVKDAVMMPDGSAVACGPGMQYAANVSFSVASDSFIIMAPTCVACAAGLFQPLYVPLSAGLLPASVPVRCGPCPGLQQGSYFAASVSDVFLDWTGVFDETGGSGIAYYEAAVGSSVGGSQLVPFTRFDANTTSAALRGVTANPGSPLFLTLVAVDSAGNGAVLEDLRPVFLDASPPLQRASGTAASRGWP